MKKIGIDASPLQGPHRMRGIGYVTQHLINNIPSNQQKKIILVLYVSDTADLSAEKMLESLNIGSIKYELRLTHPRHHSNLPGRLALLTKVNRKLYELNTFRYGSSGFGKTDDLDVFIQFDQSQPFPKLKHTTKKILIGYDIIPFILEADYLWGYKTARRRGLSRKASVKCYARRQLYKFKLIANIRNSNHLLAISKTTARDIIRFLNVSPDKISQITLGIPTIEPSLQSSTTHTLLRYKQTCWGYIPHPYTIDNNEKFLLFVGGADPRRKLEDLVAAFNQLRAKSNSVKLVLAGDSMQGPNNISNPVVRKALLSSSFTEDIIYAGFVDNRTRDWLYMRASAFVFPSVYEGFGLPVLEALSYGTPVISYENDATIEVAEDGPIYVNDVQSLTKALYSVLQETTGHKERVNQSKLIIKRYTWKTTGQQLFEYIDT